MTSMGSPSRVENGNDGDVVAVAPPAPPPPAPQTDPVPVAVEQHDQALAVAVVDTQDPPPPHAEPVSSEGTLDEMMAAGVEEEVEVDSPEPDPAAEEVGDNVVAAPQSPPPLPGDGQAAGDDGEFACDICGASYQTEKAMFGHLRCHRDREWRGAFCPPTFSMDEFAEFQEHLVKSEEDQLREIEAEETGLVLPLPGPENAPPPLPLPQAPAPAAAAPLQVKKEIGESSNQKVVLDVDLNAEVEEAAAGVVEEFVLPDLNLPAPDDEEE